MQTKSHKYEEILDQSAKVDRYFQITPLDALTNFSLDFAVPETHSRFGSFHKYLYEVRQLKNDDFESATIIADPIFKTFLEKNHPMPRVFYLKSSEAETKEINFLDKFADENKSFFGSKIIVLGGNLLTDVGAYIAQKLSLSLIYIPTTIIAMSGGAMGGKVRVNKIENGNFLKHFYKAYYEPDKIIVDPSFLESLPNAQITIGLSEIVKHGIYQSHALLEYLASDEFNPLKDKKSLLKAILWSANLKKICLDVDPDECPDGACLILRGGHDSSDKIEEKSRFTIPHGEAVAIGLWQDIAGLSIDKTLIEFIYNKLSLRKEV